MKKLILGVALSLLGAVAHAQWVEIATNPLAGVKFLVHPASKERTGDIVNLWTIQDLLRAEVFNGKTYLSMKVLEQYNCKKNLFRITSTLNYSDQMGSGTVVFSGRNANSPWHPIMPGIGQTLFNYACK